MSNAAAEYHVNLDDQVDGVLSRRSFRGSRALVYQGSARSTGQRVAIKTFYFGPPSDDRSMNVSIGFFCDCHSLTRAYSACSSRG